MKKTSFTAILMAAACTVAQPALAQQTKNPVSTVVREILPRQQRNLIAAVEEMPASKFSFKPTPEQMSFAHLVLHITESNYHLCALLADLPPHKASEATSKEGKDDLVPALKDSFDYCSKALEKVDDTKLADTIEAFGGKTAPRAWALIALTNDWAEHYGAAAMYLRLNGMLPPTAKK